MSSHIYFEDLYKGLPDPAPQFGAVIKSGGLLSEEPVSIPRSSSTCSELVDFGLVTAVLELFLQSSPVSALLAPLTSQGVCCGERRGRVR